MEDISREFRVALPWELYADDLVVIAETEDDLIETLSEWKDNMENRGMRINMNKWRKYDKWRRRLQDGHVVSVVDMLVVRIFHLFTLILIINHPLSASFIYYDP